MSTGRRPTKKKPSESLQTAEEGIHYKLYADKVVCQVSPCKNSVFKTQRTFGNHACKKHGLISPGTSPTLYALDSDDEQKRQRSNAKRRKQPGQSVCYNYIQMRGSMCKRWSMARYNHRKLIWARYVKRFEENRLRNSIPTIGDPPILINLLKAFMPSLGFNGWDCLSNDGDFAQIMFVISSCDFDDRVLEWTEQVLQEITDGMLDHLPFADRVELHQNCIMLKSLFTSPGEHCDFEQIRRVIQAHRKMLCEEACRWLTKKAHLFEWEKKHGWARYDEMAGREYVAWKRDQKPRTCETTLPNLVKAYKSFFGCCDAEAIKQVACDAEWVDTSDEEGLEEEQNPNAITSPREQTNVIPTEGSREHPICLVGANSPQGISKSLPPAVISISEGDDESRSDPSDPPVICLGSSARDDEPTSEKEVIPLDDFTNTQVLFGHGSFGGITFSQSESGDNICLPGNCSEPVGPDGNDHVFSAVLGLCSLSQDLSPSPSLDVHDDSVLGAVDSLLMDSQAPESVPMFILGSQDLPEVFRTSTPFVDVMSAGTQASQSTQIFNLLACVDDRIVNAQDHQCPTVPRATSKGQHRKLKLKTKLN